MTYSEGTSCLPDCFMFKTLKNFILPYAQTIGSVRTKTAQKKTQRHLSGLLKYFGVFMDYLNY